MDAAVNKHTLIKLGRNPRIILNGKIDAEANRDWEFSVSAFVHARFIPALKRIHCPLVPAARSL